ncbi:MAG: response regulator transcription factor, partial [Hymenobacter sp.]
MKILLVEDHPELAKSIVSYFVQEHYICEVATTFEKAREKLELFKYDVVLLDIMLPDGNGIDLLKLARQDKVESSII